MGNASDAFLPQTSCTCVATAAALTLSTQQAPRQLQTRLSSERRSLDLPAYVNQSPLLDSTSPRVNLPHHGVLKCEQDVQGGVQEGKGPRCCTKGRYRDAGG